MSKKLMLNVLIDDDFRKDIYNIVRDLAVEAFTKSTLQEYVTQHVLENLMNKTSTSTVKEALTEGFKRHLSLNAVGYGKEWKDAVTVYLDNRVNEYWATKVFAFNQAIEQINKRVKELSSDEKIELAVKAALEKHAENVIRETLIRIVQNPQAK